VKARVLQVERADERPFHVPVERRAADPADDLAEQNESGIAVLEGRAGGILERQLGDLTHRRREARDHGAVRRVRDEPGAVGQESPDRDLIELLAAVFPKVPPDRSVELDRAPLDECHHGQRRPDRLREGGDVEDRVDRHRGWIRKQAARPVRPLEQNVVATADEDHDPGDLAAGDGVVRGFIDSGKIERSGYASRWRQSDRGRRDDQDEKHDADETRNDHHRILALRV